jgi:hypothetical protein
MAHGGGHCHLSLMMARMHKIDFAEHEHYRRCSLPWEYEHLVVKLLIFNTFHLLFCMSILDEHLGISTMFEDDYYFQDAHPRCSCVEQLTNAHSIRVPIQDAHIPKGVSTFDSGHPDQRVLSGTFRYAGKIAARRVFSYKIQIIHLTTVLR